MLRKFTEDAFEDDDAISQLELNYSFVASPMLDELSSGNKWCDSPAELEMLREYIKALPWFVSLAESKASSVEIFHDYV